MNDYRYARYQTKYPGISKTMSDLYESLNMEHVEYPTLKQSFAGKSARAEDITQNSPR